MLPEVLSKHGNYETHIVGLSAYIDAFDTYNEASMCVILYLFYTGNGTSDSVSYSIFCAMNLDQQQPFHLDLYCTDKWAYTPTFRGFDSFYGYYTGAEGYYKHSNGGYDFFFQNGRQCGDNCSVTLVDE